MRLVPDDLRDFPWPVNCLQVRVGGVVRIKLADGTEATPTVTDGATLNLPILRIFITGTTASGFTTGPLAGREPEDTLAPRFEESSMLAEGEQTQELTVGEDVYRTCVGFYLESGGSVSYIARSGREVSVQSVTPGFVIRVRVKRIVSATGRVFGVFATVGHLPPVPPTQYTLVSVTDGGSGRALVTVGLPITADIDSHFLWLTGVSDARYQGMFGPITLVSETTFLLGDDTFVGASPSLSSGTWVDAGHGDQVSYYEADGEEWEEGAEVDHINDLSLDRTLTGGGAFYRRDKLNGFPVWEFTGIGHLTGVVDAAKTDYAVLCLFRAYPYHTRDTRVAAGYGNGHGGVPTAWLGYNTFDDVSYFVGSPSEDDIFDADPFRVNDVNWHLGTVRHHGTSFTVYDGTDEIGTHTVAGQINVNNLTLGDYTEEGGFAWSGYIAAAVVLDGPTPARLAAWQGYLIEKYGLPEAATTAGPIADGPHGFKYVGGAQLAQAKYTLRYDPDYSVRFSILVDGVENTDIFTPFESGPGGDGSQPDATVELASLSSAAFGLNLSMRGRQDEGGAHDRTTESPAFWAAKPVTANHVLINVRRAANGTSTPLPEGLTVGWFDAGISDGSVTLWSGFTLDAPATVSATAGSFADDEDVVTPREGVELAIRSNVAGSPSGAAWATSSADDGNVPEVALPAGEYILTVRVTGGNSYGALGFVRS